MQVEHLTLEPKTKCRSCDGELIDLISLGEQYVVNFPADYSSVKLYIAPLELTLCKQCKLVQLKHTVPRDILYKQYWYKSGVNTTMVNILHSIAKEAEQLADVKEGDIVVDIGANDGTLLRGYSKKCYTVGFEPADNLIEEAKIGTSLIIHDYFNADAYWKHLTKKAKIVTAIAMFYDLEDPNSFVKDVADILDENGIFIIQMNYLGLMLLNNAFDNISHEHLEYYSLTSLEYLLNKHGLEVFDVLLNDVNGGSFKIYIKHKNCKKYNVSFNVQMLRLLEKLMKLDETDTYYQFIQRINNIKHKVMNFINTEKTKNKTFYIYGASTRGTVVLQYFGIDNSLVSKAAERNPAKYGRKIVGSWITIVSEEEARKDKPDYFIVLPWQFIDEFVKREAEYLQHGKFLVILPEPRLIYMKEGNIVTEYL